MKKKFGIVVILALVAMCLAFTACPQDNTKRSVTFVNHTLATIRINGNFDEGSIKLDPATKSGTVFIYDEKTGSKVGADVTISGITAEKDGQIVSADDLNTYIYLDGIAKLSKKQPKDGAVSLSSGTLSFEAWPPSTGGLNGVNTFYPSFKINTLKATNIIE